MPIIQNTQSNYTLIDSYAGNRVHVAVVPIGAWNMVAISAKSIFSTLAIVCEKIVDISAIIYKDDLAVGVPIDFGNAGTFVVCGSVYYIIAGGLLRIELTRNSAGLFNGASYDDAVMNRGYIYVTYIE